MESVLYVGLDVHKESISIVVFKNQEKTACINIQKKNEPLTLRKYFHKLKEHGILICCYEAGFSGFALYHFLCEMEIICKVAAPGLIPIIPGERIKTDPRDAEKIARNLRANMLTFIHVPTSDDEAVRDYLRMRDNFKLDEKRKKQQILSFMAHLGHKYDIGKYWTITHYAWLKKFSFKQGLHREILNEYLLELSAIEEKLTCFEKKISEIAQRDEYYQLVGKLMCLKGIGTMTALSLVVEIGDFKRFETASKFMGFLGLVPSERSSGGKRIQGGLTKAGNIRLRKLLIEASWHYRYYQPSKRLKQRREGFSTEIIAYADKTGRRLSKKFQRMAFNQKKSQKIVAAIARELSGFIWGLANEKVA